MSKRGRPRAKHLTPPPSSFRIDPKAKAFLMREAKKARRSMGAQLTCWIELIKEHGEPGPKEK